MQNPFLRPIENHDLHWFNMTQSCEHDTLPQRIWKPCRHHSYRRPMCTWGILVIFGGHLGFGIKITPSPLPNIQKKKHNFNTRNGFVAIKLVGIEVLLWSLYHIGQNLGIPQIQDVILAAILDLASRWHPSVISTLETDSFTKISGFRGIILVSVLYWSKSRNSTNPRWPPNMILTPETDSSS